MSYLNFYYLKIVNKIKMQFNSQPRGGDFMEDIKE